MVSGTPSIPGHKRGNDPPFDDDDDDYDDVVNIDKMNFQVEV